MQMSNVSVISRLFIMFLLSHVYYAYIRFYFYLFIIYFEVVFIYSFYLFIILF